KKTHAWFTGYILTEKPEIVITVFLENAGGGGAMAAPVANRIFNFYMGNLEMIRKPAPVPPQFQTGEESAEEETAGDAEPDLEPTEEPGDADAAPGTTANDRAETGREEEPQ
ncbi:MAG: hypothetical protein ACP5F3_01205, partial [Candidatus Syntrophosphaera sp.]